MASISLFPIVEHRMSKENVLAQILRFDALMYKTDFHKLGRIYFDKEYKVDNGGYAFIATYLRHHGIRECMYHPMCDDNTSYHELLMGKAMEAFLRAMG